MNLIVAALFACGCVSLAEAPFWPDASDFVASADACSKSSDAGRCEHVRSTWADGYTKATSGSYEDQRMVALCLSTSCDHAIRPSAVLGCAWRIVIVTSRHADGDGEDGRSLTQFCGPGYLDDVGRQTARSQSKTMLELLGLSG